MAGRRDAVLLRRIVDHLIAIRKAAERQVEIFDKLGKLKA